MNLKSRITLIAVIILLVFSSGGGQDAAATPQNVTLIKYLTIPASAFAPADGTQSFTQNGSFVNTTTSAELVAWAHLPRGSRIKNVILVVRDNNGSDEARAQVFLNTPGIGASKYLGEAASSSMSTSVRSFKKAFTKTRVKQHQAISILLQIEAFSIDVYAVKIGYLK